MPSLQKISDITERYGITARTLRYYEEIGLLQSARIGSAQYRHYDNFAIARLEQILILRKLQLPLKEIIDILVSQETRVLAEAINRKLEALTGEITDMGHLQTLLQQLLILLNRGGLRLIDSLRILQKENDLLDHPEHEMKVEELKMSIENLNKLTDVRLIRLRPMKVAWCRAESAEPENDAWKTLNSWVQENGLDQSFTTRYFGFNNPNPTPGNPVYGYEVWATVSGDIQETEAIRMKTFPGGLYAVTNTYGQDIPDCWKRLDEWVNQNKKYRPAAHQWLEEHIVNDEQSFGPDMQLDLYYPIAE